MRGQYSPTLVSQSMLLLLFSASIFTFVTGRCVRPHLRTLQPNPPACFFPLAMSTNNASPTSAPGDSFHDLPLYHPQVFDHAWKAHGTRTQLPSPCPTQFPQHVLSKNNFARNNLLNLHSSALKPSISPRKQPPNDLLTPISISNSTHPNHL